MHAEKPIMLGMLISGGGSTMEAIGVSAKSGKLQGKVEPVVVIASKPDIGGIAKAKNLQIPVITVERKLFPRGREGSEEYGKELIRILEQHRAGWVSQNGWLQLTPQSVIEQFNGKIFNQHPGPLDPDHAGGGNLPLHFGGNGMFGLRVHAAVLKFQELAGRTFPTQATIHHVSPEFDQGAVVAQQKVDIQQGDTPETLSARMLPVEHELQITFWSGVADGFVNEVHRASNLIYQIEEPFLQQAVIYAKEAYPHG